MTKPLDPIEATTATRAGKPQPPAEVAVEAPAACANCSAVLAGEYCHDCGQFAHNPLGSFKHAVEDVFESFWHLDGRIFRTLRNLFLPGRVAGEYMAGHRVRYIPPLRLFVILSLLTFFVGKLVLHVEPDINIGGEPVTFQAADSIAEVEARRDALLAELETAEAAAAQTPGVSPTLIAARARIQGQAAARIAQLRKNGPVAVDARPPTADPATPDAAAGTQQEADRAPDCDKLVAESQQAAWLPGFAANWVKQRVRKGCENLSHVDTEGGRLFQAFMGAIPTALFVLMPFFALLLKLVYLGSGRGYLEHLVVALYSHCFLLLMLLALFLLSAARNAGAPAILTAPGFAAVWIWIPVYLWMMQRRVYGGGWLSNAVRYLVIGFLYFVMVVFVAMYAVLIGISS